MTVTVSYNHPLASTELEGVIARERDISARTAHRALQECTKGDLLQQAARELYVDSHGEVATRVMAGEEPKTPQRLDLLKNHSGSAAWL